MKHFAILALIGLVATTASAALVPIFEYSFPDSFNATGSDTVVDQSAAGNDFTTINANSGYSSTFKPAGMPGGSYGGGTGHGTIATIDLLNNTLVSANGGFTMDTWFYWPGDYSNARKLIDYAGTESLRTIDSKIQFTLSNRETLLEADIVEDTWYHVVGEFITDGGTTTVVGRAAITGTANLWLDSGSGLTLVDTDANAAKSTYGDDLNRGIGINKWPQNGEWNQGWIYNPSLYLGVAEVPEPATMSLLALGGAWMLRRRKK